jgi:hypothetical protein
MLFFFSTGQLVSFGMMSHVCGSRERNDALLVLAIVCATAKYGGYCRGGGRFRPVVVAGH